LSQTLITTYPLLGGKYTRHGLKMASFGGLDEGFKHPGRQELIEMGVIIDRQAAVPFQDLVHLRASSKVAEGATKTLHAAGKAGRLGAKLTEMGLKWSGFQGADEWNRAVAYFGQKQKTIDFWNLFKEGKITKEQFETRAGLNYFGDSTKAEFFSKAETIGAREAAKWMGLQASNNTNWLYQLGAGPSLFSHGAGRLFGQYGTWPAWYLSFLIDGAARTSGADRAVFVARTMAAHSALVGGGAAVGLNLSRWTGLSSLSWMGGPFVDWFVDFREIWTGVQASGDSSAQRDIALSKYGLEDTGGSGPAMLPSALGGRIGLEDPRKLAASVFGVFLPGYLGIKDIFFDARDAINRGEPTEAIAEALNIPTQDERGLKAAVDAILPSWMWDSPGHEWPESKL
jgi:hypothetical protein